MARVKVTSSDIHARLARGECANFRNGCRGRTPCAVVEGETCRYFDDYVKPLLDVPEFAQRYAREAKVKLALNPNAKVVRKRRDAGTPRLDLSAETATEKPAKAAVKAAKPKPAATAKPARKTASAPQLAMPVAPQKAARAAETPAAEAAPPRTKAPAAALKATEAPRKPRKGRAAAEKPVEITLELAPEGAPAKKTVETPPARRQSRAKAEDAPAPDLAAKPKPAPKRAPAQPVAATPEPANEPPAEKRSIMITPQLELVLDFPLERPTRTATKRR